MLANCDLRFPAGALGRSLESTVVERGSPARCGRTRNEERRCIACRGTGANESRGTGASRLPHDRLLTRVAALPLFLVLAAFEIAWLLLLAYAAHRFLLQPILEY